MTAASCCDKRRGRFAYVLVGPVAAAPPRAPRRRSAHTCEANDQTQALLLIICSAVRQQKKANEPSRRFSRSVLSRAPRACCV
jgi:hypothetical protein